MFGWPSDVILYQFGGVARFAHQDGYTTGRSIVVNFAGPWAGFLLYGLVLAVQYSLRQNGVTVHPRMDFAFSQLEWINLYWGLVNLLPVLPLDGGQISQDLFHRYHPRMGVTWCLRLGTVVGGATAVVFLYMNHLFPAILFGLLAVQNFQQLEQTRGGW